MEFRCLPSTFPPPRRRGRKQGDGEGRGKGTAVAGCKLPLGRVVYVWMSTSLMMTVMRPDGGLNYSQFVITGGVGVHYRRVPVTAHSAAPTPSTYLQPPKAMQHYSPRNNI